MNMLAVHTTIDNAQNSEVFELDRTLKFEMKTSTLKRLLSAKQVCASDFHCLDRSSQQSIKMLCLQTCLECTHHDL